MTEDFTPIDHKDDSADYRSQVWEIVEKRVGAPLTQLPSGTTFEGTWDVEFDMFGTRQPMFRYDFQEEGTVEVTTLQGAAQTQEQCRYSVARDGQMTLDGETFHAATTEQGELVLFNGDSSLVLVATKT
ncbi:hypothetical protein Mal4_49860 [Maioricimonas rarisocia]|uniref:Lipocalin-like domain-containing protein n=1 Tax=Maioricimonas rarisocia TaxID=2528026 RepID=A0A517ZDU1_9PLAN|nr:hypothetical protein [Maioricimonas rarisocia]QDU40628.1 hypothetical protein Mal4_49860 [Maioricimonas rarisocia]